MPRLSSRTPIRPVPMLAKRWLASATLVFGSYNPSGISYLHWVQDSPGFTPFQLFVGILLFLGLLIFARVTYASLGYFGITAVLLGTVMAYVFGAGLDLLVLSEVKVTAYSLLFWATGVLASGSSWSFLQGRISGERDILRTPP